MHLQLPIKLPILLLDKFNQLPILIILNINKFIILALIEEHVGIGGKFQVIGPLLFGLRATETLVRDVFELYAVYCLVVEFVPGFVDPDYGVVVA